MTEPQNTPLQPMPDDWRRALAVVAHPDDVEYGCSAAIAAWTDGGRSVAHVLAGRGEAGIDTVEPRECGPLREREQRAGAAVVGVTGVEFLDHRDGVIEYGIALRRDIAAAIRRHRPELVITMNHRDTWNGVRWVAVAGSAGPPAPRGRDSRPGTRGALPARTPHVHRGVDGRGPGDVRP